MIDPRPEVLAEQTEWSHAGLERIELRQLQHLVEICRAGSFSGAARRLKLSQPALSKSIARIEAQFDVQLFERSGGAARPTQLGKLVAERARLLLTSVSALNREIEQHSGGAVGRLRIGVGPTTRLRPMPQLMELLPVRFPELSLEVLLDDAVTIMRRAQQGRYDLVFGFSELAESFEDLIRVKIFEDDVIVVARPGHPLTLARSPLSASELLDHPMASTGLSRSFSAWAGDLSDRQRGNATALVSNDIELLLSGLPQTHTLRGSRFVFERALAVGELVEVPVEWRFVYHCWMLTTPENWRRPVVKAVADMAREGAARARGGACLEPVE